MSALLDNEADETERAAVSEHLTECGRCREAQVEIVRLHRVMRVHPSEPVPDRTSDIMRALPQVRRGRAPVAAVVGAIAAAAVAAGTLVVIRNDPTSTSATVALEVSDAVVTRAPSGGVSVLSLTVRNRSNHEDALVAVTTPVAADVSLHATHEVKGRAEMQSVDEIAVGAGQTRELGDETSHVMLLDLYESLEPGVTVKVELRFARGEAVDVDATVTA